MVLAAEVREEIEIPEGVQLSVDGNRVSVSGKNGKLERAFSLQNVQLERSGNGLSIFVNFPKMRDKALVGTVAAHVRNMIIGVTKGFEYNLKVSYSHFPVNVSIDGKKVVIKNFLGEKHPRTADIMGSAKVEVKGQDIAVKGNDLEEVSQTAANLVQGTKIRKKDIRVFKDGIFIVSRGE